MACFLRVRKNSWPRAASRGELSGALWAPYGCAASASARSAAARDDLRCMTRAGRRQSPAGAFASWTALDVRRGEASSASGPLSTGDRRSRRDSGENQCVHADLARARDLASSNGKAAQDLDAQTERLRQQARRAGVERDDDLAVFRTASRSTFLAMRKIQKRNGVASGSKVSICRQARNQTSTQIQTHTQTDPEPDPDCWFAPGVCDSLFAPCACDWLPVPCACCDWLPVPCACDWLPVACACDWLPVACACD